MYTCTCTCVIVSFAGGPKWKDEYSKAQYLSIDEMRIVKNTLAYNIVSERLAH